MYSLRIIVFLMLTINTQSTLILVTHDFQLDDQDFQDVQFYDNLAEIELFLKGSKDSTFIFPEYTISPVNYILNTTESYAVKLAEVGTYLCMNGKSRVDHRLRIIGCYAKNYKKNLVLHIVEYNSNVFYSTVISINSKGILGNIFRKTEIQDEKSILPYKENQNREFEIEGLSYGILIAYDIFHVHGNDVPDSVIYYGFRGQNMPFFNDYGLMYGYSILYKKNIWSSQVNGLNKKIRDAISISYNSKAPNLPIEDFTYDPNEGNYSLIKIVDKKAEYEWCSLEVEIDDPAELSRYKLAIFNGPYTPKKGIPPIHIMICGLMIKKEEMASTENIHFKTIKLTANLKDARMIPSISTSGPSSSELPTYSTDVDTSKHQLIGNNIINLVSFGWVAYGSYERSIYVGWSIRLFLILIVIICIILAPSLIYSFILGLRSPEIKKNQLIM